MCRWVVRDAEAVDADDDEVKDSATRTTSNLTLTDTVLHLQLDRSIAKHLEKGSCFFPREIAIE